MALKDNKLFCAFGVMGGFMQVMLLVERTLSSCDF
jgi:gamma-glutamyltranspeptidase